MPNGREQSEQRSRRRGGKEGTRGGGGRRERGSFNWLPGRSDKIGQETDTRRSEGGCAKGKSSDNVSGDAMRWKERKIKDENSKCNADHEAGDEPD